MTIATDFHLFKFVTAISLTRATDAFEYYFFHFVYFLINPHTNKVSSFAIVSCFAWIFSLHRIEWSFIMWSFQLSGSASPSECLHPILLEQYLNYFLPLDADSGPPQRMYQQPQTPSPSLRYLLCHFFLACWNIGLIMHGTINSCSSPLSVWSFSILNRFVSFQAKHESQHQPHSILST